MIKEEINLYELAANPHGLVIAPMLESFVPEDDETKAYRSHRHDTHGLFLLLSGQMTMIVEGREVVMTASSLMLVQPGQIHQCLSVQAISGWVMFFDSKFLDAAIRSVIERSIETAALFQLDHNEPVFFQQLLLSIYQAAEEMPAGKFQTQMLHALINALYYKAADMYLMRKSLAAASASRGSLIVQDFKDLIKLNFKTSKRPADYAQSLHISVSHLNDTLKMNTGYSATHLIQQAVIGEGQRILRYTAKSVKEIACSLGYTDHKYFTRLFTKVVGQSPSEFRKTSLQKHITRPEVLVFRTNVSGQGKASDLVHSIRKLFPEYEVNFDLEDCENILRIKGKNAEPEMIRQILQSNGYACEEIR
ncbi:MAG: AraC family transcriptional regulator [Sphingobacteriaceae bacterium]|nr:MAG: AraC family transcriptional regulator [Sphingobacteriaceae bacterium]